MNAVLMQFARPTSPPDDPASLITLRASLEAELARLRKVEATGAGIEAQLVECGRR